MTESSRIEELWTMPYEEYLQTPEWQDKREIALRLAEYRCQICNSPDSLHVHHRTYERRGCEALADLTVLCKSCHELFHNIPLAHEIEYGPFNWLGSTWSDVALREKTFKNFEASKQANAYGLAQEFIEYLYGSLVLHGTIGTGKTHLMAAMCNGLLAKHNKASLYTTAPKLFAAIGQRIQENVSYQSLLERAISTPLLCLDDIDKTKYTEWREEIYFSIVDERVKRGLPIALSTNRFKELHLYTGGAVASRLKIGQIPVEMNGNDYRDEL